MTGGVRNERDRWSVCRRVGERGLNLPAKSGPGSFEDEAVDEDCQPETYTVSRYFAICVTCTGSNLAYKTCSGVSGSSVGI